MTAEFGELAIGTKQLKSKQTPYHNNNYFYPEEGLGKTETRLPLQIKLTHTNVGC